MYHKGYSVTLSRVYSVAVTLLGLVTSSATSAQKNEVDTVEQQRGACHCGGCHRWFRSRGGLAVHRCTPNPGPVIEPTVSPVASSSRHLHRCEPTAKRAGQTAKHGGPTTKRPTVAERVTFTLRCVCGRRFRRRQDLARHSSSCKSSSSAAP